MLNATEFTAPGKWWIGPTGNYAPSHMAEAGVLQHFVGDADFLVSMSPTAMRSALRGLARSTRQNPVSIYDVALPFLCDEPGVNATILELVSQIHGNGALSKEFGEVSVNRPYAVTGNIRPFDRALSRFDGHTDRVQGVASLEWPGRDDPLARFDGHTDWVIGVATLAWPGLDHPVIVTTSGDGTARVWDPRDPRHELARHTGVVTGVAALEWPGLDHPVIVIASSDGAGRIWDPRQPHSELGRLAFLGEVNSIAVFNRTTLAVGCSRGFLVFELKADQSQSEQLQRHSGGRYASR